MGPMRGVLDDDDLVAQAQEGDRGALDQLLHRHYDRIYGICRRLLNSETDAADATQQALIAIVRGLANFDRRSKFSTWYYRVATNCCLDELRRINRRATPSVIDEHDGLLDQLIRSDGPGFDQSVVDADAIQRALELLPSHFRTAVVLRDQAQLSYSEIAEILGVAVGTVRSRIARGRARLADLLLDRNHQ